MVALIWFISIPVSCFLIGAFFKDATRYTMIPCMVTSLVFMVFALALSIATIVNMLANPNSFIVQILQGYNILVYLICQLLNFIYRVKYAKKDLLRTEEEEIDV
jgi:Na+/proline symporter